jgi:hypothetical protein
VTLKLKKVPYEHVLRSLMEILPANKTRPNFAVGGNVVEITTTAELGKHAVPRLYELSRAAGATADGGKATPEQLAKNAEVIRQTVHKLLLDLHEDVDAVGRSVVVRDRYLVATQSKRAQVYIGWAVGQFESPAKLGKGIPGTATSVREKKAWETLAKLKVPVAELAAKAETLAPELNVIFLPGTQAELGLTGAPPQLDFLVTDGGIVEVGPAAEVQARVTLGVYDLRELIRRMTLRSKVKPAPAAGELASGIVAALKEKVLPYHGTGAWGELEKSAASVTLCDGLMVVFAPVPAHRAMQGELEKLGR